MMSSTFGAPLGGTTRGGHHGVEFVALSLITPPNFIGGGGICFPSRVTVALGEPGTPTICCAIEETGASRVESSMGSITTDRLVFMTISLLQKHAASHLTQEPRLTAN